MPLLYWQLNIICPEFVPERHNSFLRERSKENAARNLILSHELYKILELFKGHNIRAIPYKGPILAAAVYGNIALRQFKDLDILIRSKDVPQASEVLNLNGYHKVLELTSSQELAFLKIGCERTFANKEGQILIDLHWDFVPRYFSLRLDLEGFWKRLEPISPMGIEVRSFAPEDLLLILCLNAAKEFWKRLILLCDIAEVIRAYPNINWPVVIDRGSKMGLGRVLNITLLLAHEMLGSAIPKEISAKITEDSELRRLVLRIGAELLGDKVKPRSIKDSLMPAKILGSRPGRIKFYLRLGLTPTIEDWTFISLPSPFFFLYYLTRPLRLSKKLVSRFKKSHS
jgi:hypothetical protein